MKKVILTAVLVSGFAFVNYAQDRKPVQENSVKEQRKQLTPAERSQKDADWAEKKLALTGDQKSKWQAASLQRINANEQLREKLKGSTTPEERKQMHSQMKSNALAFDSTVQGLLSAEQKAKYEEVKKERHDRHQHNMKHDGQPGNAAPPSDK